MGCCSSGGRPLYAASILALFLVYTVFTCLVCLPLLTNSSGMLDYHWIACTGVGVGADELNSPMNGNVANIVLLMEQHTAEGMINGFYTNVGTAIVGHGLGLIGLFGIAIQEIAKPASSSGAFAILATLVITCLFYLGIISYCSGALPNLSGDGDGEWTKVTYDDFGLKDGATCFDQNPWMVKFEDILARAGSNIQLILIVTNVILIIPSALAYAPAKSSSSTSSEKV